MQWSMFKAKWWFFMGEVFCWLWSHRRDDMELVVMFERCCETSLMHMENAGVPLHDVERLRERMGKISQKMSKMCDEAVIIEERRRRGS